MQWVFDSNELDMNCGSIRAAEEVTLASQGRRSDRVSVNGHPIIVLALDRLITRKRNVRHDIVPVGCQPTCDWRSTRAPPVASRAPISSPVVEASRSRLNQTNPPFILLLGSINSASDASRRFIPCLPRRHFFTPVATSPKRASY